MDNLTLTTTTKLDFFLWGHISSKVYCIIPTIPHDMKNTIRLEFQEVSLDVLAKTNRNFQESVDLDLRPFRIFIMIN